MNSELISTLWALQRVKLMDLLCVIVRGAPGSGKSTWVRHNYPHGVVCSADNWRTKPSGEYVFKPEDNRHAHDACAALFDTCVNNRFPTVIVDNTNVKLWEFARYIKVAKDAGYTIHVVRLTGEYHSVHHVPYDVVVRMRDTFEDWPGETILTPTHFDLL